MDNEKIPEVLYKYYPSEKSWDFIFNKKTIRFTPFNEFNDPFEAKPTTDLSLKSISDAVYFCSRRIVYQNVLRLTCAVENSFSLFLKEVYLDYIENIVTNRSKEERLRKKISAIFSSENGSLCLTKSVQNILMWSHYANSHKGFVIGFNTNKIINELMANGIKHDYSQIKYTKNRPVLTMHEAIGPISNETANQFAQKCFFTKSDIWEYEKEWRILINLTSRENEKSINPVQKIPPCTVSCVIFGMSMPVHNIWEKCREIKNNPKFEHIQLKRAILHETEYSLKIVDIYPEWYEKILPPRKNIFANPTS